MSIESKYPKMNKEQMSLSKAAEMAIARKLLEYKGIDWGNSFQCPVVKELVSCEYCESFATALDGFNHDLGPTGCKYMPTCEAYKKQKLKEEYNPERIKEEIIEVNTNGERKE